MSQVTRCPHCQTCFRVVPDQLRVADGWVRCGQCKQIFDALASPVTEPDAPELVPDLLQEPQPSLPPWPALAIDLIEPAWQDTAQPFEETAADDEAPTVFPVLDFAESIRKDEEPLQAEDTQAPEEEQRQDAEGAAVDEGVETMAPEIDEAGRAEPFLDASDTPEPAIDGPGEATSLTALLIAPAAGEPAGEPAAPQEEEGAEPLAIAAGPQSEPAAQELQPLPGPGAEPGFVRAARRGAFWKRPVVRAALVLLALVLGLGLALQVALRERDLLAARHPSMLPWLQQLCAPMGCAVQAPRSIADVVIEASSFVKARGDAGQYVLEVGLQNRAPTAVAMPALELTLVDALERTVVRRVLMREDLGAPAALDAGALWTGSVQLQVLEDAPRFVGYRVLAFYP